MVALIDLIRIAFFALIGSVICYQDLKLKKISNYHILILILGGIFLFLLTFTFEFLPKFFMNFFLSFLVGIFLWKFGIWKAGDAKFFAASSLFLPFLLYSEFFPSALILINSFLLSFFAWILPTLIKTKRKEKIEALKLTFNFKNILNLFLIVFGLFYFLGKLFSYLNIGLYVGYILALLLSFLIFSITQKIFQKKFIFFLLAFCILRIFDYSSLFSLNYWVGLFLTIAILSLAIWIGNLSFFISYEERYLEDLKVGDIPIGLISKKKKVEMEKILGKYFDERKNEILKNGFDRNDLKKVKEIREIKGFIVKKYVSFSPLLLISTLLVAFLRTDILMFLVALVMEIK